MWQHRFRADTDLPPAALWPILADVARWPEVDANIAALEIAAPPAPGVGFRLKPKGGPWLRFTIGDFAPPHRYSDICRMPLATMTTRHVLVPGPRTGIEVEITIEGPLARFWGWTVGRRHAAGLPAQTERLLAAARAGQDRNPDQARPG